MESFGCLLKKYIQEQGFTIYQIAKDTGIDRSFLQGVLSGSRKLPQKRFTDIINLSHFTVSQISELCNAYYLEKVGQKTQERFLQIELGITGKIKERLREPYKAECMLLNEDVLFLSEKTTVLQAVHTALSDRKIPYLYSNFSFENDEINRIVYCACCENRIEDFFHCVSKNDGTDCHNINLLFHSLHYAEEGYLTFITEKNYNGTPLMPYFILTNKYFIQYDNNCNTAIILKTKTGVNGIYEHIAALKQGAKQNVFIEPDPFKSQIRIQLLTANNPLKKNISFDNAVGALFITPQIIQEIATSKIRNVPAVIQHLQSHFELSIGQNYAAFSNLYLSYEAITAYVKTGRIPCFPPAYAKNVPLHLRAQLISNLLEFSETSILQLTNPVTLPMKHNIATQIGDNNLIVTTCNDLATPTEYVGKIIYCTDDKTTVNDFLNYYDYLSVSEKTFSADVSKKVLNNFLKELESI